MYLLHTTHVPLTRYREGCEGLTVEILGFEYVFLRWSGLPYQLCGHKIKVFQPENWFVLRRMTKDNNKFCQTGFTCEKLP